MAVILTIKPDQAGTGWAEGGMHGFHTHPRLSLARRLPMEYDAAGVRLVTETS